MRKTQLILAAVLAALIAAPAFAYTIVLKDGGRVTAREKFEVVNGQAILTLQNGTQASYDLNEIDLEATEAANKNDYGTAQLIQENVDTQGVDDEPPPPPRATLSDLIKQQRAGIRKQEQSRRTVSIDDDSGVERLASGAPDLSSLKEQPFPNLELVSQLQQFFRTQGIGEVTVLQSTEEGLPLVKAITSSEASVFRALAVAASALSEMRARHGETVPGLDLLLMASPSNRAGQFSLTPDMARELLGQRTDISNFYVKYVDF